MAERQNLSTNKIALEETELLQKLTMCQILARGMAGVEYDVHIKNYRLQELDNYKALQSFTLRLVDVILSC